MNELLRLQELHDLRELHLHQLANKAMAPFCAAVKVVTSPDEEEDQPEVEDRMAPCHNCGQFRACSAYNSEWYCKGKCLPRAKRGVLSRKRAQDIEPRRGR